MRAAKSCLCASAACRSWEMSTLPLASVPMLTIFIPHIAALAGLVPCADVGMMQTLRCWSPRLYTCPKFFVRVPNMTESNRSSNQIPCSGKPSRDIVHNNYTAPFWRGSWTIHHGRREWPWAQHILLQHLHSVEETWSRSQWSRRGSLPNRRTFPVESFREHWIRFTMWLMGVIKKGAESPLRAHNYANQ